MTQIIAVLNHKGGTLRTFLSLLSAIVVILYSFTLNTLMSQIATSRICIVVIIRKRGLYIFNSRQLALNMLRHEF